MVACTELINVSAVVGAPTRGTDEEPSQEALDLMKEITSEIGGRVEQLRLAADRRKAESEGRVCQRRVGDDPGG